MTDHPGTTPVRPEVSSDAGWRPIDSAPRNGLTIMVGDPDCGQFLMHWEPAAENGLFPGVRGFWVSLDRSFTWSEHDGMGPTYWLPMVEDAEPPK